MTLPDNHQQQLRAQGILQENEVIAKEGDLYVATDVLTGARRIVPFRKACLRICNAEF